MTHSAKSCAVALPMQRNCATHHNAATTGATGKDGIQAKALSVKELRAQLRAQQVRNQCATAAGHVASEVALNSPAKEESCAVAFPKERNTATGLLEELMEVDNLPLEEAQGIAAISIPVYSPETWLAMISELDQLIDRYCNLCRLGDQAKARILAARNCQPLATIPESLEWFRRALQMHREKQGEKHE